MSSIILAINFLFGLSGFPRYPFRILSITSSFLVHRDFVLSYFTLLFSVSLFFSCRVSMPGPFSFPQADFGCSGYYFGFYFHLSAELPAVGLNGCLGTDFHFVYEQTNREGKCGVFSGRSMFS